MHPFQKPLEKTFSEKSYESLGRIPVMKIFLLQQAATFLMKDSRFPSVNFEKLLRTLFHECF